MLDCEKRRILSDIQESKGNPSLAMPLFALFACVCGMIVDGEKRRAVVMLSAFRFYLGSAMTCLIVPSLTSLDYDQGRGTW